MKLNHFVIPLALVVLIGVAATPALARQGSDDTKEDDHKETRMQEREHKVLEGLMRKSGPSVHIQGGKAALDAALVTAVSGDELTVKLFGMTYIVNTGSAKKEGTPAVDSRVWVKGKVNESNGEIDAVSVRTFTAKKAGSVEVHASTTPVKLKSMDFDGELKRLLEKLKSLKGGQ